MELIGLFLTIGATLVLIVLLHGVSFHHGALIVGGLLLDNLHVVAVPHLRGMLLLFFIFLSVREEGITLHCQAVQVLKALELPEKVVHLLLFVKVDLERTQIRHTVSYGVDSTLDVLDRVPIQIEVRDQAESAQVRWESFDVVIGKINLLELGETRQ